MPCVLNYLFLEIVLFTNFRIINIHSSELLSTKIKEFRINESWKKKSTSQ